MAHKLGKDVAKTKGAIIKKKTSIVIIMQSDLLDKMMFQKKIPIIGKGTADEIVNKFKKLINNNYEIIKEITLRSEEALETAIKIKRIFKYHYRY